jgi:hypothetical protein
MDLYRDIRSWLYPLIAAVLAVVMIIAMSCKKTAEPEPPVTPWQVKATGTAIARATDEADVGPQSPLPSPTKTAEQPTPQPSPTPITGQAQPTPAQPASGLPMTSPDYGIQAFLWWRNEVATRDLGLIKDMGFRWVKQVFAWADIEGAGKDAFNWTQADLVVESAEKYQVKLIARLDRAPVWTGAEGENGPPQNYEDFGDFCYEVAKRYKGRIHAYQIWNEPNLAREWGNHPPNPKEYTRLLSIAFRRIKEADPDAIVISAGLTPTGTYNEVAMPDTVYLEQMYQAGFQDYCDMVGLHGAGFKAPPEVSPDEAAADKERYGGERFFCFRHIEDMREIMLKHGDGDRRIAILEFGWTTDTIHPEYAWHAVSLEQQADYMVRAYKWAEEHWQPWIGVMNLIYIADSGWSEEREEYWWAITYPQYPTPRVKPAYNALRDMPKVE